VSGDAGLLASLVGVVGVVLGALLAALFALHRERLARRQQTQVQALYELQEACLAHRQAWEDFAEAQAVAVPQSLIRQTDRTSQRLDLVEARLRSDDVRRRAQHWRRLAKPALLQDDRQPVSTEDENEAWLAVQSAVRSELLRLS
jgi:hypothetical protein